MPDAAVFETGTIPSTHDAGLVHHFASVLILLRAAGSSRALWVQLLLCLGKVASLSCRISRPLHYTVRPATRPPPSRPMQWQALLVCCNRCQRPRCRPLHRDCTAAFTAVASAAAAVHVAVHAAYLLPRCSALPSLSCCGSRCLCFFCFYRFCGWCQRSRRRPWKRDCTKHSRCGLVAVPATTPPPLTRD